MSATSSSFYVIGGTLRPDAPCYVERQADADLYDGLCRGEYCYVLTPRQMGKSSLMARTAARLRQGGAAVVTLDLTAVGRNLSPEQWYGGLLARVGTQLDLEKELDEFWLAHERLGPLRRWMAALREVALARVPGPLVIFVDEIDVVRSLPFSTDEFFAGIRECYNRRTDDPEFNRVTFCLLGVATPSDLIRDTRLTPFNIGRRIELTDFTEAEAAPLAAGLTSPPAPPRSAYGVGGRGQPLLHRILHWTGGHPYLTQRLCRAVADDARASGTEEVDRVCKELFLTPRARERDDNLLFVRERLLKSEADLAALLELYARVRRGQRVPDDDSSPLVGLLRLSGIVRPTAGLLRVRNRLYARVFDREWVQSSMPDAEVRRQQAAYRRGLVRATAVAGVVIAVMATLALIAVNQARRADRVSRQEARQRRLAQEGQRVLRRTLYASQVGLAQQAWEAGDTPRARELLDAQRPHSGEEDLRGFEWRYLWRLLGQDDSVRTIRPNGQGVTSLAFSPDGKQLATCAGSNQVLLWDSATMRRVAVLACPRRARRAQFSPDGKLLAVVENSPVRPGVAFLWDVAGRRLVATLRGHMDELFDVAFSPDGRAVATAGLNTVRLWRLDPRSARAVCEGQVDGHHFVRFSPDGRLLATFSGEGPPGLWDIRRKRWLTLIRTPEDVGSLAFSPDGTTLALGCGDAGIVQLWDGRGKRRQVTLGGGREAGNSVLFSRDGKWLATTGRDAAIRIWGTAGWNEVAVLRGHRGAIAGLAFSPDGTRLASWSDDRTVKLWQTARREEDLLRDNQRRSQRLLFSRDGRRLFAAVGNSIQIWDSATKRRVATLEGHRGPVDWLALSPDGKLAASGGLRETERLWDLAARREIFTFPQSAVFFHHPVAFSPDGRTLALTRGGRTLVLWDVASRREKCRLDGHEGVIADLSFSPDGSLVATCGLEQTVRLWSVDPPRPAATLKGWPNSVFRLAFSPDGKLLAAGGAHGGMKVWNVQERREVADLKGHGDEITSVAFSADGKTLAVGSWGEPLRLWNVASWQPAALLRDPALTASSVAFSPDGNLLATGRTDNTIRLWRAAPFAEMDAGLPRTAR
jgi:WD40 repeat protein